MSDSLPPVAKNSSDSELRPSEGSEPGTVDHILNDAPQLIDEVMRMSLHLEACGLHRQRDVADFMCKVTDLCNLFCRFCAMDSRPRT